MSDAYADLGLAETEELLLELLDTPIAFHRCFVTLTGKVSAALLLSYLWGSEDAVKAESEGWIARPLERIRDETGLSRDELASARKTLRGLGILQEARRGMPPVVAFRVDRSRVARLLVERARRSHAARRTAIAADDQPWPRLTH